MKIITKFFTLLSIMISVFVVMLALYIGTENRRVGKFIEEQKVFRHENFKKIIELIGKPLETWAFDYTWWDEMANFALSVDIDWAKENLDPSLETFKSTDYWVYNTQYSLIYSGNNREDESLKELPVPPSNIPQLLQRGTFCHFFVYTSLGLMEIRGAPITTSDDADRIKDPVGYFFVGRLWTEDRVHEIAMVSGSDIEIAPVGEEAAVQWGNSSRSKISFQEILTGWDGSPIAVILVQSEVAGFQEFYNVTRKLLAAFIVFMFINLVLIVIFSRFWITAPLGLITKSLSLQDPKGINSLTKRETEFGGIAKLIEQFFIQKDDLVAKIADRRRAEENLLNEKHFTESIITSMPGLFYIFDKEGAKFIRRNDNWATITGYTDAELDTMTALDFFSEGADRDKCLSAMRKVYAVGYNEMENDLLLKSGIKMTYYFTGRRIVISDKEYLVGMGIDISERKKAEKEKENLQGQLQQSQKMRSIGVMANGIAHNFNNILGAARGRIDMALTDLPPDSRISSDLKKAVTAIMEAKALSDKMLTFSRKEDQKLEHVRIQYVLDETIELFQGSLAAPIEIRKNIDINCGPVLIDANEIKHVVMNLCINAYHSMAKTGGILEIGLKQVKVDRSFASKYLNLREGPYVQLTVKDNGHGMEQELISRIFEPFFTTKEVGKGTGLGLSIVHGIVTACGGEIDVDSLPGKGTTFTIYLPVDAGVDTKKA